MYRKNKRAQQPLLLSDVNDLPERSLKRLWRILSEDDQAKYVEIFQPYIKESAGQYTYRLKGCEVVWAHIRLVGQVLQRLLNELAEGYSQDPLYAVAQRFFDENFVIEEIGVRAKKNNEITPGCLQSLDDLEATYRKKGNRAYKGYVANIAETCHPDNPVQLIDQVQVAPNLVSDIQLLKDGMAALKDRTGMDTAVTDGGYISPEIDQLMRTQGVQQITTSLTGRLPDHKEDKLAFSDFVMEQDHGGEVIRVTCPAGKIALIQTTKSGKSYRLSFPAPTCRPCPFFLLGQCPVEPNKYQTHFSLIVPKDRVNSFQRRRHFEQNKEEARNLRTAVEATVFQLKHKWIKGKLRVRGLLRITNTVICSALAVNLRRIDRYQKGKLRDRRTQEVRKSVRGIAVPA